LEAVPIWAIAGASSVALSFRLKRFGGELSVRLFEKDFHAPFGFLQLLLALARQAHTFFEEFHRFVERKLRALESSDYFFQPSERALKIRLFGLLRLFGYWLVHAIPLGLFLAVRTVIGRPAALFHAPDGSSAPFAGLSFMLVSAQDFFQALKPPLRVDKVGRRIQTAF
jgi:hypothetical protein